LVQDSLIGFFQEALFIVNAKKPQVIMFTPRLRRGVKKFHHRFMSSDYLLYVEEQVL
jgi:hypothetical protein